MLVCFNVKAILLPGTISETASAHDAITASRALASTIEEAAAAADDPTTGTVFAALVDDPASVNDYVNAYLGQPLAEAASASDTVTAGLFYNPSVVAAITATDTSDATITPAVTATTWNPSDKGANITLSNGNLTLANSGSVAAVRSTTNKTTGKIYYEVTWTGSNFNFLTSSGCGLATSTASLISAAPTNTVFPRISDGTVLRSGSTTGMPTLGAIASGDTVSVAIDMGNHMIWFRKNAGNWNGNAANNPATNTGGVDISAIFASAAAFAYGAASSGVTAGTANFGATSFGFSVPSGFSAWT